MTDFLGNIKTSNNIEQTADIILSYELLIIEKLNFQLVIHTAYRPFEGLIIDLKVKKKKEKKLINLIYFRHIIYVIMLMMLIDYV